MGSTLRTAVLGLAALAALAAPAAAQSGRPAPVVELATGYAGFLDDDLIDHFVLGGGARVYVSPRVSIGPEIVFMRGPGHDRDLFVTGNVAFDLIAPRPDGPARLVPYVLAGGGWLRHSDRFFTGLADLPFHSDEGAFTGGGGVRIALGRRVYVAPEIRGGWEPHTRVSVTVGVALH